MAIRSILDDREKLRAEAERRFASEPPTHATGLPSAEILHELQVHQIELEMQNEELRRVQVELEEANERYAKLYDFVYHFAPVGYFTVSKDGLIRDANLTGAALLGQDRQGLMGHPFARFLSQEDGDRWHLFFRSLKQHGEWGSIKLVIRRKDGSVLPARLDCDSSVGDDKASVVRIVLTDMTEQVRAEKALHDREEQLRIVLDGSRDGNWDWFESGKTITTARTREILGLANRGPEIILSGAAAWTTAVHPDDLPAVMAAMAELESARSEQVDIDFRWASGGNTWKWVHVTGRVLTRNDRGKVVRAAGTVTDVSEVRRLHETLQRLEASEARLAAMVRNFPGGAIGLFDHSRRLVAVEAGDKQSLAEGLLMESWAPEHRERVVSAFQAALAGRIAEVETHCAGKDVEVRTGPVLDSEGQVVMGVVTVQVITKRREAGTRVDLR
jgi:PAS domain S-box-containing protein